MNWWVPLERRIVCEEICHRRLKGETQFTESVGEGMAEKMCNAKYGHLRGMPHCLASMICILRSQESSH